MTRCFAIILLCLLINSVGCSSIKSANNNGEIYECPPCNMDCDKLAFSQDGVCPHCKMNLILKTDSSTALDSTAKKGSGSFFIQIGERNEKLKVFYHKPKVFNRDSKVVFVLHGAGRNAHDYRDAWVTASERYNLLVISPFDNIFKELKQTFNLTAEKYDMFGHSAGAQLLHRMAIFKSSSKANRVVAANSGWYTVPIEEDEFPYGLNESNFSLNDIGFDTQLIILIGENEGANETRGQLRKTEEANKQGRDRLERGRYFYNTSKQNAERANKIFNWQIKIVPGIGHDYQKMGEAAAEFLYETNK